MSIKEHPHQWQPVMDLGPNGLALICVRDGRLFRPVAQITGLCREAGCTANRAVRIGIVVEDNPPSMVVDHEQLNPLSLKQIKHVSRDTLAGPIRPSDVIFQYKTRKKKWRAKIR